MPNKPKTFDYFGNDIVYNSVTFPETRLQTLDRRFGKGNLFFAKEQFEKSVDDWENIPIIFHSEGMHPDDFDAVSKNPETAAESIGGKLVGRVRNPRISIEGHPELMATLEIEDNENEIVSLYKSGKLSLSTAFSAANDGDKFVSPPIPNHVLLFEERLDEVMPVDLGAYVHTNHQTMNGEQTNDETEESKLFDAFKRIIQAFSPKQIDNSEDNAKEDTSKPKQTQAMTEEETFKEIANIVGRLSDMERALIDIADKIKTIEINVTELKTDNEQASALKEKLNSYETAAKEAKFNQFLHSVVPEGMKATDAMKTELRSKYDTDPVSLVIEIMNSKTTGGATSHVGQPYTNSANTGNYAQSYTTVGDLSAGGKK